MTNQSKHHSYLIDRLEVRYRDKDVGPQLVLDEYRMRLFSGKINNQLVENFIDENGGRIQIFEEEITDEDVIFHAAEILGENFDYAALTSQGQKSYGGKLPKGWVSYDSIRLF